MKTTLRLNAKALPVIAALSLIMQVIDPSRVWVILLIGIGGTWLFCRWWMQKLAASLQFKREMRFGWAQVGDRLEERFVLENKFSLPAVWVEVQDQSTLPDHYASLATGVDGNSTSQWKIVSTCTRRGVFTLGGTTLETGDPFGIYTLTLQDFASSTLAVMPPVVTLPRFDVLTSGWAGEGKPNPRSLEETTNASHTREMVPGDPQRLIHWGTSARKGRFYIREFDGTHAGDWWILLDLHKDSQAGTGWDSTEEHGVILAASLITQGLNEDHSVGLAINGQEPAWHVPRRNEYQSHALLRALATATPSAFSLKEFLQRNNRTLGRRSSLLIITAATEPAWIEALVPLMRRGILPTVFLFDLPTFGKSAEIAPASSALHSLGIPCHIIPKTLLDTKQTRPGHEGEWEWRVTGTGKAVAIRKPTTEWKGLE